MKESVRYLVKEKELDGTLFVGDLKECVHFISKELRNRDKKDGFDDYWHNASLVIVKERTIIEEYINV